LNSILEEINLSLKRVSVEQLVCDQGKGLNHQNKEVVSLARFFGTF